MADLIGPGSPGKLMKAIIINKYGGAVERRERSCLRFFKNCLSLTILLYVLPSPLVHGSEYVHGWCEIDFTNNTARAYADLSAGFSGELNGPMLLSIQNNEGGVVDFMTFNIATDVHPGTNLLAEYPAPIYNCDCDVDLSRTIFTQHGTRQGATNN